MRKLRWAVAASIVAVLGGALFAPPAFADGGPPSAEGYVMVQQALSYLVTDTSATGTAQALKMVNDALAAKDQEGVAVPQVEQAKAAIESGSLAEAQTLLQGSIKEALAALKPAKGEETGTTIVVGPLKARATLSASDWTFLILSVIVGLLGVALAYAFRPRESLGDLRRDILATPTVHGDFSRTVSTSKAL